MSVAITSNGITYSDGINQSGTPMLMGGTNPTYNIGTFLMTSEINPTIPQAILNANPNDAGTPGYLEAYASWYNTTTPGNNVALNNTFFSTMIAGYRTTSSATNALTGTWRSCGWASDGTYSTAYFYIFFRRVA